MNRVKTIGQRSKTKIDAHKAEDKRFLHRIDKRAVTMQAAGGEESTGTLGATMVPTEEQLAKINEFTRVDATVDNVVAFGTDACNDIYDRDDERFRTDCVKDFAELPQPFSPIGKSYMLDHEYKMENARGRIFDASSAKKSGTTWLNCDVYVPKTPQYSNFIESIDFGIANFVSVGVVIDKSECSICKAPVYTVFRWSYCANGHEKGLFYVPGKEEDDGWGFFEPVDPSTKGAVKAMVDLFDPIDMYELSQVFLGAQYMAELAKEPGFKGILKAATAGSTVSLGSKLPKGLTLPHEPPEVIEARRQFRLHPTKDHNYVWIDASGIRWEYDTDLGETLSLGLAADADFRNRMEAVRDKMAEARVLQSENESDDEDEQPVQLAQAVDATLDELEEALDDGEYDQASDLLTSAETTVDELIELLGGTDADDKRAKGTDADGDDDTQNENEGGHTHEHTHDNNTTHSHAHTHNPASGYDSNDATHDHSHDSSEEGDKGAGSANGSTSTRNESQATPEPLAVLKAARTAKLPMSVLESWDDGTLEGLLRACSEEFVRLGAIADQFEAAKPKFAIADKAVTDAKAQAVHWFTVAHRDPKNPDKGVNVSIAQKMIDRCGDDLGIIMELSEEWKKEAQAKFPNARRSTAPADPNEALPPTELPDQLTQDKPDPVVRRLHG